MENQPAKEEPLVHDFQSKSPMKASKIAYIVFAVVIFLGIASGYVFAGMKKGGITSPTQQQGSTAKGSTIQKGQIVGSKDSKTFKDTAEGTLKKGGVDGEGEYHLERPGGDSQNVYMTSSVIDLSQYQGHKVRVWGQTNSAQTAGWLMDVGRLEVLE